MKTKTPTPPLSTERLLSSPDGFGLTSITPAQRAICRAIDGRPIPEAVWNHEDHRYAEFGVHKVSDIFGGVRPHVGSPPKLIVLLAGIRAGKSLLISAVAAKAALAAANLTSDPPLKKHEVARVTVLSSVVDVARTTFEHLLGGFQGSQLLRGRVQNPKTRSFEVRRDDGRRVEVYVAAQGKDARTLVSRWSAGVIIDEAPRQASGADGYVVNIEDQISGVWGRVRDGAQIFLPGSPVGPSGFIFALHQEHFARPSKDVLVIQAPAYLLNPYWWTVDRCREFRDTRPDDFECEVLGRFRGNDNDMFPPTAIDLAMRDEGMEKLDPMPGARYVATIDPATRGNSWVLTVGSIDRDNFLTVSLAKEWIGTPRNPLDPAEVFRETATLLAPYGVTEVWSDLHHFDSNQSHAKANRLQLRECSTQGRKRYEMYADLREKVLSNSISLPKDQNLRSDLVMVRKRVTPRGEPTVVLQQGTNGRHCDYAAALAILAHKLTYTPRFPVYDPSYNRYLPGLRTFGL